MFTFGRRQIEIRYLLPDQGPRTVMLSVPRLGSPSLLQISLENGVPHATHCGGRGQCGACLVRIVDGGAHIGSRTGAERRMAAGRDYPIDLRLACQIHPRGDMAVEPLVSIKPKSTQS